VFAQLETLQTISLMVGILGIFTAGVASLIVIIEKITGSLGRWFERHFKSSLEPTNDKIEVLSDKVDKADTYNRYHLGPNGETMPVHERLKIVEQQMALVAAQDQKILKLTQAAAVIELNE
jgi:hypothetical protein